MLRHLLSQSSNGSLGKPRTNWLISEKVDGMRVFWDSGVTRGQSNVPWANKDDAVSTGLWSRYGNVIHAPDWWLDKLPPVMLDGELYIGRGEFSRTMSVVKRLEPGAGWQDVRFVVLDTPSLEGLFQYGEIKQPSYKKVIDPSMGHVVTCDVVPHIRFSERLAWLEARGVEHHSQTMLPYNTDHCLLAMNRFLDGVLDGGGEGVVIKDPDSLYIPSRVRTSVKIKGSHDSEGVIVGLISGCGRLTGQMGALRVKWNSVVFDLGTGFTDEERVVDCPTGFCVSNPGSLTPNWVTSAVFKRGSKVTFRYRELSPDGVPKEARYWRKRVEE